jgi:hypothetical protein
MDVLGYFEVGKLGNIIPRRETRHEFLPMFINPALEIIGNTYIQDPRFVGHDVDVVTHRSGFPDLSF